MPANLKPEINPNVRRRAFAGGPTSVDIASRSFDVVISTPTPVVSWVPHPTKSNFETQEFVMVEVDEVLVPAGVDLQRAFRMPFLDCHDDYSGIDKILGKIENIHIEGEAVIGRATLTRKRADLMEDIAEGFYGQISARFEYDIRSDAEFVEREGQRPLVLVNRWTLLEASAVGIGADPNSYIRSLGGKPAAPQAARSLPTSTPENKKMNELETLVTAAEDAVAAVVAATDEGATEEVVARAKALRKLRAEDATVDPAAKTEDTPAPADAARAEGEDAPLTPADEKEIEAARSIARELGGNALKSLDQMAKLRSRPAAIRKFLRSLIEASAGTTDTHGFAPNKHADQPAPRARSAYEKLNKRS